MCLGLLKAFSIYLSIFRDLAFSVVLAVKGGFTIFLSLCVCWGVFISAEKQCMTEDAC